MTQSDFDAFDATRDFSNKAFRSLCYAPHANLFFDTSGLARACCWNWEHPLGNVRTDTIQEIWRGARASILRSTLESYSLGRGCQLCKNEGEGGWTARSLIRNYDVFAIDPQVLQWPKRMEFSISNVCNLECVMCNGDFSSAIRTRREKRAPMDRVYSEVFLESLREYLPHLERANFLGGEPFLINEYYILWQMLIEVAPSLPCEIFTNATQMNDKIQYVMNNLQFSFAVSLDGATKSTVESIRKNASFKQQLVNLKIIKDYTVERGTQLYLTFCFMRQNWQEFGLFCQLADDWDCDVRVNYVTTPHSMSIAALGPRELRQVIDKMELESLTLSKTLTRNRDAWFSELTRWQAKWASKEQPFVIL